MTWLYGNKLISVNIILYYKYLCTQNII